LKNAFKRLWNETKPVASNDADSENQLCPKIFGFQIGQ